MDDWGKTNNSEDEDVAVAVAVAVADQPCTHLGCTHLAHFWHPKQTKRNTCGRAFRIRPFPEAFPTHGGSAPAGTWRRPWCIGSFGGPAPEKTSAARLEPRAVGLRVFAPNTPARPLEGPWGRCAASGANGSSAPKRARPWSPGATREPACGPMAASAARPGISLGRDSCVDARQAGAIRRESKQRTGRFGAGGSDHSPSDSACAYRHRGVKQSPTTNTSWWRSRCASPGARPAQLQHTQQDGPSSIQVDECVHPVNLSISPLSLCAMHSLPGLA